MEAWKCSPRSLNSSPRTRKSQRYALKVASTRSDSEMYLSLVLLCVIRENNVHNLALAVHEEAGVEAPKGERGRRSPDVTYPISHNLPSVSAVKNVGSTCQKSWSAEPLDRTRSAVPWVGAPEFTAGVPMSRGRQPRGSKVPKLGRVLSVSARDCGTGLGAPQKTHPTYGKNQKERLNTAFPSTNIVGQRRVQTPSCPLACTP